MKLIDLIDKAGLRLYSESVSVETEVTGGYTSDLLSDVMGRSKAGQVWITLQNHLNVIAVASLRDLAAVVLVNGQEPVPEVLQKAREEGIPLLGTNEDAFTVSARIYQALNLSERSAY